MYRPGSRPFLIAFLFCCIALLVVACGSSGTGSTPNGGTTPVARPTSTGPGQPSTTNGNGSPGTVSTTVPMPTTQTNCPASGSGRAAIMAPLALGSHQNIVYIVNQGPANAPTLGTLKRYDVTTGNKTEILNLSNTSISEAQVSSDGQWILFVAITSGQAKLQLVRMDGRGLQTLYCANTGGSLHDAQWSTDQKLIIFDNYTSSGSFVDLLNTRNGSVQVEISLNGKGFDYPPLTWLDTTRLYLLAPEVDAPSGSLYLLDSSNGANQNPQNLPVVVTPSDTFCWDSDSSYDATQLYTAGCTTDPDPGRPGIGDQRGPSTINVRPATGGSPRTIFTNANMAITAVRAINKTTLLFLVENSSFIGNADTSNNGLWKVNTDGTGLTRLTSDGAGVSGGPSNFCQFTQDPWSNVSRDGNLFALQHNSGNGKTQSLLFGSLNSGTPTTFASISDGTQLSIAGWTTM
ncbi:MAG TPA: hypothetical protein VJ761_13720 [Ktedonobacteraceae bacterium]|nr:hypothetical protein [Ktedonobacteraceae bacterium]